MFSPHRIQIIISIWQGQILCAALKVQRNLIEKVLSRESQESCRSKVALAISVTFLIPFVSTLGIVSLRRCFATSRSRTWSKPKIVPTIKMQVFLVEKCRQGALNAREEQFEGCDYLRCLHDCVFVRFNYESNFRFR
jgi:hypothetical protein